MPHYKQQARPEYGCFDGPETHYTGQELKIRIYMRDVHTVMVSSDNADVFAPAAGQMNITDYVSKIS